MNTRDKVKCTINTTSPVPLLRIPLHIDDSSGINDRDKIGDSSGTGDCVGEDTSK